MLQPPEPTAGKPAIVPVSNTVSVNSDSNMASTAKKKESDYITRIQQLESNIQQLTRANQQWQAKTQQLESERTKIFRQYEELKSSSEQCNKQLESERTAIILQYDELKSSSEQRNADLQHQIDELRTLIAESANNVEGPDRKRVKPSNTQDAQFSTPASPSVSQNNTVIATPGSSYQPDQSSTIAMETEQVKVPKPPPIFVHGVTSYPKFINFLRSRNVADCLKKETNSGLILSTASAEQYRKLHAVLRLECADQSGKDDFGQIQLHSYQLKEDRAFVVFIRGLPSTMETGEIADALREQEFKPRNIFNVPRKVGGVQRASPLFRVELEPAVTNTDIYKLSSINQVRVKVEPPKPQSDPPHCRNCQRLGHIKHYCLRTSRCIKCGADHISSQCTLQRADKCTCANCGESHPANYRGCRVFQQMKKKPHKATDEIRRRESPPTTSSQPIVPEVHSSVSKPPVFQHSLLPSPNSAQSKKTFASAARSSPVQSIDPFSQLMSILSTLSTQLAGFDQRLSSLEKSTSANTNRVRPSPSKRHNG